MEKTTNFMVFDEHALYLIPAFQLFIIHQYLECVFCFSMGDNEK